MLNARIALLSFAACCFAQPAPAVTYLLIGNVYQFNSESGVATYDFGLSLQEFFNSTSGISLELVSPTGVRFPEIDISEESNVVSLYLKDITAANLDSTAAGVWTIEESVNGTQLNQYQFTVPDLLGSNRFLSPPVITSPENGAKVDKVFDVTWTNGQPSSVSTNLAYANGQFFPFPDIHLNSTGNATFSYEDVLGIAGAEAILRIGRTQDTFALRTVTPLNPEATSQFTSGLLNQLAGLFVYRSYSVPVSFTIVPEPASLLLVCVAVICATRPRLRGGALRGFVRGD